MPLDSSHKFHGPADLAKLVEAIFRKDPTVQETDWVEWKSSADLNDERWWAEIGLQIVGFGNRMPNVAEGKCEGFAYLVLGVEPGSAQGVKQVDPNILYQGITPYVGPASPRWDPKYVEFKGVPVLIVEVVPPHWGDPIHSIRKQFSRGSLLIDSRPYVRNHGRTAPATPSEIDALLARAKRAPRPTIELTWRTAPGRIQRLALSPAEDERWRTAAQTELIRPSSVTHAITALALMGGNLRPREQREREAKEYLVEAMPKVRARALANAARMKLGRLWFDLENLGEENYAQVEVELVLRGAFVACFEPDDLEWQTDMTFPTAPGARSPIFDLHTLSYAPPLNMKPRPPRGWVENGDQTVLITFAPEDLRPKRTAHLWPVYVWSTDPSLPAEITVGWSATSKTASGEATGSIVISLSENTLSTRDLVTARGDAPRTASDGDE